MRFSIKQFILIIIGFLIIIYHFCNFYKIDNIKLENKKNLANVYTSERANSSKDNIFYYKKNQSDLKKKYPLHHDTMKERIENTTNKLNYSINAIMYNYRDSQRCANTIYSIYFNATYPGSFRVYIFEELYLYEEDSCNYLLCNKLGNELCTYLINNMKYISFKRRDVYSSKGPSVGRNIAEEMAIIRYEKEKVKNKKNNSIQYYLSIDNNLIFLKNWDELLLIQWKMINNKKAIISFAPKSVDLMDTIFPDIYSRGINENKMEIPILCTSKFNLNITDRLIKFNPPEEMILNKRKKPVLQSQMTELFHFGLLNALKTVRTDPYSHFLYDEESEFIRATRFWTNGYDFYAPTIDFVYKYYDIRNVGVLEFPSFTSIIVTEFEKHLEKSVVQEYVRAQKLSRIRNRRLLKLNSTFNNITDLIEKERIIQDEHIYGLGTKRSLEQWKIFSNINLNEKFTMVTDTQFVNCKELEYVPFVDK